MVIFYSGKFSQSAMLPITMVEHIVLVAFHAGNLFTSQSVKV
ncbi:Uncharacterized protein BN1183_CL_00100 [Pantoea ananatis]|nr:hypothetical protein PANA5342_0338 [Pantoea ananatis LMG 5342]CRH36489.1 Uncharacterized protein BN1183_CL_00100 [Pantoea ananatis]